MKTNKDKCLEGNIRETASTLFENALQKEGKLRIFSSGWSMFPVIFPGDTIWLERCRPEEVKIGDILLVKRRKYFVLHRLRSIRAQNKAASSSPTELIFITKGDALSHFDAPSNAGDILARVRRCGNSWIRQWLWQVFDRGVLFWINRTHFIHNPF